MRNTKSKDVAVNSVLRRRTERGRDGDPLLSVMQDRGVVPQEKAGRRNISSADKKTYWRVYPGDIVYNTMRMWQGASANSNYFGIVSPAYTVCLPVEGNDSQFLAYTLKLPKHINSFRVRSQGITSDVWNLRFHEFARIELTYLPPLPQQQRIAEILATVDEAIEQTEALIAKTRRIKAGLMHDLFTRGVTADGQLRPPREQAPHLYKESQLGWIPKEWEIAQVGSRLFAIEAGWSPECIEIVPGAEQWGVLKVSAVTSGEFVADESKTLPITLPPRPEIEIHSGDVLTARANGVSELVGVTCLVRKTRAKLMLSDKVLRLRPNSLVGSSTFLAAAMQVESIRRQIGQAISGSSGQKNISQAQIRRLIVAWPNRDEQERIAQTLNSIYQKQITEIEGLKKMTRIKAGLMGDLLSGRTSVLQRGECVGIVVQNV